MVNCEAVEILSYFSGLARSAGFELPDLGSLMGNANCGGGFACDPLALSTAVRVRHRELLQRQLPAAHDISELSDGYLFHLNTGGISFIEAAQRVDFERRCCLFLAFQLQIVGGQNTFTLSVTGPAEVKPFIDSELRQVQRRIAAEESHRYQFEAGLM